MAISLAQITGGLQLKSDILALQKAYDAAKVITSIEKTAAEGENPAVMYNVDELLNQINSALNGVNGEGSFDSVKEQLKNLSEKKVKDTVRVQYTAAYDAGTEAYTIDASGIDELVPGIDKTIALNVYTVDNKAVYDTEGNQLKFSFEANAFTGVPAKLDLATSKANSKDATSVDGNTLNFTPMANTFQFKVFPVGTFELGSIPEAALLDNEEVDLLAYDKIINKIIVELAKDDEIVAAIVEKVGENTVAEQVSAITDALAARILALESGKFDKSNIIVSEVNTAAEGEEPVMVEQDMAATAETASDEKVVSEKVLVKKLAAIQTAIADAKTTADDDYVAKLNVIRSDAEGENAIKTVRAVAEASDDKVVSEKVMASEIASLDADIATAQSAADAAQATADAAIPKADIVTEVHPVALGEGESGDIASNEKVASEKAVVEALDALEEAFAQDLEDEVNARATEDAAINSKITAHTSQIEALNNITKVEDTLAVGSAEAVTSFTLSQVPNADKVTMFINGVAYFENEDFTVDRETKIVTWTSTEFDITNEVTSKVRFVYRTGNKITGLETGVKVLHQDFLPTNGTFNVGDLVYRLTMTQGNNIGWVCTEAGTPGTWTEFGVVDFGETIKVVEEDE